MALSNCCSANNRRKRCFMAQSGEKEGRGSSLCFLLDLDGTLVDSVYLHVPAWQEAFQSEKIDLPAWRIHRRIGMSGGLLVPALLREIGREAKEDLVKKLEGLHGEAYGRLVPRVKPLPGAHELLAELSRLRVPWAIITSSKPEKAEPVLKMLDLGPQATVITRGEVQKAKPEPEPFLKGAQRLGVKITDCAVIGDSVWDLLSAQRARALGVGLLTGGYGREELERAGAYRVYADPAEMLARIDELGVRADG